MSTRVRVRVRRSAGDVDVELMPLMLIACDM